MMNELEVFKYALFPSGANYSDADLKRRVADSMSEVKVLLGEYGKSVDYSILYRYSNDQNYLWLVAVAINSAQRSFHSFSEQETITEFAQRIQERVSSLPIVLNSVALEIEAQRYNANHSILEDKQLVSLVLKQSGRHRKIEIFGQVQRLLFPECDPYKYEQEPRLIRFKVNSLAKYEALIYEVEDPRAVIPKGTKVPLVFGADKFHESVFNRLANRLYREMHMQLIVHAKIEILEAKVVEYHFHSDL